MTISIDSTMRAELEKMLMVLIENIEVTKTQYDNLVKSYRAVGKYLEETSEFAEYDPVISPQGSLRLGTIIQPINKDDDLDVDLVLRLKGKNRIWTQKNLKEIVGNRLKNHATYRGMLDEEGRRCWTILYRQESNNVKEKYHMDILPCVAEQGYQERLQRMSSMPFSQDSVNKIAIRITDKQHDGYESITDIQSWLKSNPDGYALWFASRCKTLGERRDSIVASIMPIEGYTEHKSVLQRIVQILKRHRDIMFKGDDDKPISIIITTLAALAYNGETSLVDGLVNVVNNMAKYITKNDSDEYVISNPINPEENFADKWPKHPKRKDNFFKWLERLEADLNSLSRNKAYQLQESFGNAFGRDVAASVFNKIAEMHKAEAKSGALKVSATGVLGTIGKTLNASNTFYGEK